MYSLSCDDEYTTTTLVFTKLTNVYTNKKEQPKAAPFNYPVPDFSVLYEPCSSLHKVAQPVHYTPH
jgi:hypothetical protein